MCNESTQIAKTFKGFAKSLRAVGVSESTANTAAAERYDWAILGQVARLESLGISRSAACGCVGDRFGLDAEWLQSWLFGRQLAAWPVTSDTA